MKRCKKCDQEKPEGLFHSKGRGVRDCFCRDCRNAIDRVEFVESLPPQARERLLRIRRERLDDPETRRRRYQEKNAQTRRKMNRERGEWFRQLKRGKPCKDCGGVFHVQAMDFDHTGEKAFDIAVAVNRRPQEEVMVEIAKCDLVCANCHRVRTARRRAGLPAVLPEPDYTI